MSCCLEAGTHRSIEEEATLQINDGAVNCSSVNVTETNCADKSKLVAGKGWPWRRDNKGKLQSDASRNRDRQQWRQEESEQSLN